MDLDGLADRRGDGPIQRAKGRGAGIDLLPRTHHADAVCS